MINKRIDTLQELVEHKKHILDSCLKVSTYLLKNGEEKLALDLMKRAFVHDVSKLTFQEFHALDAFDVHEKYSEDNHTKFTEEQLKFLKIHWKNNKHHPEYWDDVNDMKEIDIIEMVCDWHARSIEFNNNLIKYIANRQLVRFAFPEHIYSKILMYAEILLDNTIDK